MTMTFPEGTTVVPLTDLGAMTADVAEELGVAWKQVLMDSSFIGGEAVERFETEWAAYCGTRYAVGVANGTDALELTLRALGIGAGDEVIVPANTFVATAEAVVLAGASPRFVDVDPDTLLVSADAIANAVTSRTAAVIVVHLYGNMPDLEAIGAVTDAHGLVLLEDAAQAHGSRWRGRPAGSLGMAGSFSFYPSKTLGAFGDAGAVVTNDDRLAARIRSIANHGRTPDAGYVHTALGRNSRLDGIQAAVLSTKLAVLDRWNESRRRVVSRYRDLLPDGLSIVLGHGDSEPVHHQAVVRVTARDRVRTALAAQDIETGIHYPFPCHLQRPFRPYGSGPLPVVEEAAGQILSLPLFPHITDHQLRRVCDALADVGAQGVSGRNGGMQTEPAGNA
ncbi:MAG: DegT/DnrJ/EryC1/StrS family aminotransferase [Actinomycetota bacterium]